MIKKFLLSTLLASTFLTLSANEIILCGDKIEIGKKFNLKWKKEQTNLYTNFTDQEKCEVFIDSKKRVKKAIKHMKTFKNVISLPPKINERNFKQANVITNTKNGTDSKLIKSYVRLDRFIKSHSKQIKFIDSAYVSKKDYARLITICQKAGEICSIDIEYGPYKQEKK